MMITQRRAPSSSSLRSVATIIAATVLLTFLPWWAVSLEEQQPGEDQQQHVFCDIGYSRTLLRHGDVIVTTFEEIVDKTHTCACHESSGRYDYEIVCTSKCELCSSSVDGGKCYMSSEISYDYTDRYEDIGIVRYCLASSAGAGSVDTVTSCYTYNIGNAGVSMAIDGVECESSTTPAPDYCTTLSCSELSDQDYDLCLEDEEMFTDPSTSLFAFLDGDFVWDECGAPSSSSPPLQQQQQQQQQQQPGDTAVEGADEGSQRQDGGGHTSHAIWTALPPRRSLFAMTAATTTVLAVTIFVPEAL